MPSILPRKSTLMLCHAQPCTQIKRWLYHFPHRFTDAPEREGGADPTAVWLKGSFVKQYTARNPMNAQISLYYSTNTSQQVDAYLFVLVELWGGNLTRNNILEYWARPLSGATQSFELWPGWKKHVNRLVAQGPVQVFLDGHCDLAYYPCTHFSHYIGCLSQVPMYYQHGACQSCGSTDDWCADAFCGGGANCEAGSPFLTGCASSWGSQYQCGSGTAPGIGDCSNHNC